MKLKLITQLTATTFLYLYLKVMFKQVKEVLRISLDPRSVFIFDTVKSNGGELIRGNNFFTMFQGKHQKKINKTHIHGQF